MWRCCEVGVIYPSSRGRHYPLHSGRHERLLSNHSISPSPPMLRWLLPNLLVAIWNHTVGQSLCCCFHQCRFFRTCTEKSFQCSWISLMVTSCDPLARHHRTGPLFDLLVHINLTPVICLLCKWFIIMPAFYVHYGQNVNYKMGRCGPRFHVNPLTWRLRLWLTLRISASCLSVGAASCCIDSNKVGLGLIAI